MFNEIDDINNVTAVVSPSRHNKKHRFIHIETTNVSKAVNMLLDFNYKIVFIDYESKTIYCKDML